MEEHTVITSDFYKNDHSITIVKLAIALVKAQKNIGKAIKGSENPFYKNSYADLSSVIQACKEPLNNEGISVLQSITNDCVVTILLHESGEWISSKVPIVTKDPNDPQKMGSAITYAKRYGLQSLALVPSEDDDGNSASEAAKAGSTKKSDPPKKPVVMASEKQIKFVKQLLITKKRSEKSLFSSVGIAGFNELSSQKASEAIDKLMKMPGAQTGFKKNEAPPGENLPDFAPMNEDVDPNSVPEFE